MKKVLILLCFLSYDYIFAHGQLVHQHIARQSYQLLKTFVGQDIREMKDHIGYNEEGNGIYNPGGKLVIGAYREDEEDALYNSNGPLDYNSTLAHFWHPDLGDNSSLTYLGRTYINAYQKALTYYNGSFVLFIPATNQYATNHEMHVKTLSGDDLIIYPDEPQYGGFYFSYYNLVDLYKYNRLKTALLGKNRMYNATRNKWVAHDGDVYISKELKDCLVWELLGRISHLLTDMSVPAHVHGDFHWPDKDSYEEWMNYGTIYNQWTYQSAIVQGGLIDPTSHYNPLKYLFYSTAQRTDFFASDEYNGNNEYGYNEPFANYPGLSEAIANFTSTYSNPQLLSDPTPLGSMNAISNNCFVYATRTVAGLFYMFAKEAGLLPIPITGVSLIGTETLYQGATGVWGAAAQNGLEPFTYNWQIKYVDGGGYLQSFASVKAEKEKKDKDKKKDGGIIINLAPSNEWVPLGLNSDVLTRPHNPTDLRDYYLKCSVTDASGTTKTSNEWFVDVTNDLPPVNPPLSNTLTADNLKSEMNALAKEMEITETPKLFSLEQNYPNPFNPTTRISYSIKEAGLVTLKVFDILGREVSTLVNEVKPAGRFEVEFNASDLPSGTYIYRLTAGNYQTINKMSFVK